MVRVAMGALGAALFVVGLLAWFRARSVPAEPLASREAPNVAAHVVSEPRAAPPREVAPAPAEPSFPVQRPIALARSSSETNTLATAARDDLVAGPRNENLVPGAKPHPITSEHERRYREVSLLDAAWDALEAKDFARARHLIDEHRRDYGDENADLDEGMSLLADCMEHPTAETRARAQRFYDEETYSTARRRIRRWCLAP